MLKNLNLSHKIILMPGAAALALLLIFLVIWGAVSQIEGLITLLQTGYFPAAELNRDLHATLIEMQRELRDAVASQDEAMLADADALRDTFLERLAAARINPTLDPAALARIESHFRDYYRLARDIALRMMAEETGLGITTAQEEMLNSFRAVDDAVEAATARGKENVDEAMREARENARTA